MANLTDDHVVEVIGAINIFDKKGDGKLPADKLVDCLRALGLNPLKSDVSKIVKDMQECNVQERIDVEDFLPIYEYFLRKKKPSFQELCDGLKALNPNEQVDGGIIPAVDLRIALTSIGDKLSDDECNSILKQVMSKKELVDIEKLVHLVMGDTTEDENHVSTPFIPNAQITHQQPTGSKAVFKILD